MSKTFFKAEIETTETWVLKRPRYFIRSWCGECNREVSFLVPEEAARLTCVEFRYFQFLMEQNQFHIHHFGAALEPYICLISLCSI
ncbi:MAG: hypothetical protein K1X72_07775 [Pyrinomonadaceae bacterium]|nr:hypothetical protein [Pyrinomonadaceae bacterium]